MKDMDKSRWEKLEPLLEAALDMDPVARARFLDDLGTRDDELRSQLSALLEADAAADGFLDGPGAIAAMEWTACDGPDGPAEALARLERAGPYRILEPIGRGGMGAVYLAERADGQFEQKVALKVLPAQAGSEVLRRRFLKERQIQAQLAHPNVARLFDGGVTEDGRPYLVMEYVDGRPITVYCREKGTSVEGRIDLFLQVCEAVAYANRNLVVHRDLKPSNILVSDSGEVKLLDFGIAKLLESEGSMTETASSFFTPDYAAPEQIQGRSVTTATDVYALGLVLYELLTGVKPFEDARAPLERLKSMLETVPKAPSRVTHFATEGKIHGDLDAICLKALRPEPDERYPSADALREDLLRYRDNRPVAARHGTSHYRFRKFARRNRLAVATVSLVLASMTGATLFSLRQARLAARERDRARAINDFLVHDMLQAATPEIARGEELTVAEVLGAAARRVGASFEDQPELEAGVRLALGSSYLSLGDLESSREHLQTAVALRARALGDLHPETLEARSELAEVHLALGNWKNARTLLDATFSAQKEILGTEALATLVTEGRIAELSYREGDYLGAERRFSDVIGRLRAAHPIAWREELSLRVRLGNALNIQRKDSEAEASLRETLSLQQERLGPEHPDTLATTGLLVNALRRLERVPEALPIAQEALRKHEEIYGPTHPKTMNMLESLARLYWYEDTPRAGEMFSDLFERSRKSLGPEHPETLGTLMNLAQNARMLKKYELADSRYREALAISRRIHGDEHPTTLRNLRFSASFLGAVGRDLEARKMYQEILSISEKMAARETADATFLSDYAWLLMTYVPEDMRDPVCALPLAERAVALTNRKQLEFLHSLARAYRQTDRLDDALAIMMEIYRLPDAVHRYDTELDTIEYLAAKGDPRAVEDFLLENLARRREARKKPDPLISQTIRLLGLHHLKQKRYEEAESWLRNAVDLFRKRYPEDSRAVARTESELGEALLEQGRYTEAEALLERSFQNLQGIDDVLPEARARLDRLYRLTGRSLARP